MREALSTATICGLAAAMTAYASCCPRGPVTAESAASLYISTLIVISKVHHSQVGVLLGSASLELLDHVGGIISDIRDLKRLAGECLGIEGQYMPHVSMAMLETLAAREGHGYDSDHGYDYDSANIDGE